jgi:hypothetical protein
MSAIDHILPFGGIYRHILQDRSRRQRAQPKGSYLWRLAILHKKVSECGGRPTFLFHPETNMQGLAALDREQLESACLVAE